MRERERREREREMEDDGESNKRLKVELDRVRREMREMEESMDLDMKAVTRAHAHQRNEYERKHVEAMEKQRKEFEEVLRMKQLEFEEKLRHNDFKHKQTHVILLSQLEKTKARLREVLDGKKDPQDRSSPQRRLTFVSESSSPCTDYKKLNLESKADFWASRRDASMREEERRRN